MAWLCNLYKILTYKIELLIFTENTQIRDKNNKDGSIWNYTPPCMTLQVIEQGFYIYILGYGKCKNRVSSHTFLVKVCAVVRTKKWQMANGKRWVVRQKVRQCAKYRVSSPAELTVDCSLIGRSASLILGSKSIHAISLSGRHIKLISVRSTVIFSNNTRYKIQILFLPPQHNEWIHLGAQCWLYGIALYEYTPRANRKEKKRTGQKEGCNEAVWID